MAKYYHKGKNRNYKIAFRLLSFGVVVAGAILFSYTFFPIISWQVYFAPVFASQKIQAPIPARTVLSSSSISNLIASATNLIGTDYTNAYNWYPGAEHNTNQIVNYKISIPKLDINNAVVTNKDSDLTKHLVQFNADTFPPSMGNSIIFGHSTLPQLYDPKNYKTIFANAYKLSAGDIIILTTNNRQYDYKIYSVTVVEPTDTTVLAQDFSDSFLTIITCTPPGTIWKRLIIKARLEKI